MRYDGAKGKLTVLADSCLYAQSAIKVCRRTDVRFSITVRLRKNLRNLIEAIPSSG